MTCSATLSFDDLAVTGTGRYVRMRGTVRGTTYGYSLWEFEVYGTSAAGALAPKKLPAEEMNEKIPEGNVLVSPNPTSSGNIIVRIYSDKVEDATLTLMTDLSQPVSGVRKTLSRGLNIISIPARGAAKGIYFISVQQGNKQLARKVIIQ